MKKKITSFIAVALVLSVAYSETITNYVYVVSNAYVHTFHEHTITQNIKNTHHSYHYTNYLQDVVYQTQVTIQSNITQNLDVSQQAIIAASNSAVSAQGYATSASQYADQSARSASTSSGYASQAGTYSANASTTYNNVRTYGNNIINQMNAKQDWFDSNYGKMVTNNVIYDSTEKLVGPVNTNYYYNVITWGGTNKYVIGTIAISPQRYSHPHSGSIYGVYDGTVVYGGDRIQSAYAIYDENHISGYSGYFAIVYKLDGLTRSDDWMLVPSFSTPPSGMGRYRKCEFSTKDVSRPYIAYDLGIYDALGNRTATIAITADVSSESTARSSADTGIINSMTSLSNWVERTFQKR